MGPLKLLTFDIWRFGRQQIQLKVMYGDEVRDTDVDGRIYIAELLLVIGVFMPCHCLAECVISGRYIVYSESLLAAIKEFFTVEGKLLLWIDFHLHNQKFHLLAHSVMALGSVPSRLHKCC